MNQDGAPNPNDTPDGEPDAARNGPRHSDGHPREGNGHREDPPRAMAVSFTPQRFERELWIDSALRRALVLAAVIAIVGLVIYERAETAAAFLVVMLLVFGWIAMNTISANVWRALPAVTMMIGRNPAAAEDGLARLLKRRPLMRWVRLLLYHRLAAIRHRQHRFQESAAICRAVLGQPLGPAGKQRGSLLLMLAEASLQCRDLYGAYAALCELHREKLGLAERLQRLAIQTRYEVLTGHDRAALGGLRDKLLLAELMPAEHCGAVHAMLTVSARRAGRADLADWLWRRSQLLCGAEKLDRLARGAFAIGVVGPPE